MSEIDDYKKRCAKIAERFLLTVVIVDDEAQIPDLPRPSGTLTAPDRRTSAQAQDVTSGTNEVNVHSLDARTLVDSFAKHGLICAVIAPPEDDALAADTVLPASRRADMVILDWQLHQDNGEKTLELLKKLLKDDDVGRLRLIAIYTGESNLPQIGETLKEELAQKGWEFSSGNPYVELTHGHCRIVIYAKSQTPLRTDLKDRAISEDDIPKRLIGDFANLTNGLLPSIALTSLAAVRENAHKVLDRFSPELDPAFLTHRACLPISDDSQQHVVNLLDSELHAIMDDATMGIDPAGFEAVEDWLESTFGKDKKFRFGNKELSFDDVLRLLEEGLDRNNSLSDKAFRFLSQGFSKNDNDSENLDQQLAWMFNFRTVSKSLPPILQLGTTLQKQDQEGKSEFLLCMRPRCDSLRLQNEEAFPLLPLIDPKQNQIQLVLKTGQNEFIRRSVCTNPSQWSLPRFAPDQSKKCVVAEESADGQFFFTSTDMEKFTWIGELKAEFAQRVAQHLASGISRVATNNSEWLRRRERSKN